MNILFIAYSPLSTYAGGVQRVTSILSRELHKRRHNIYYLCGVKKQVQQDDIENYPISIYMDKDLATPYDKASLSLYHKYLTEFNIDIVILQYPIFGKSSFFLKNTPKNIPLISCFHSQPFHQTKTKSLKDIAKNILRIQKERYLFNQALKHSTKLCLLSDKFLVRFPQKLKTKYQDKLIAINNPNTFPAEQSLSQKDSWILLVSRLSEGEKNIHDFIDMWSLLSTKNPQWSAYIVGDGPDRTYLENYAQQKHVKNLHFEGMRSNVTEYYTKAQFICMTSTYEGWGMVLTEGMAFGCIPCVYGTYEAAYDIIDNNECGFITTPFNPQEMADKIQSLIDNEEKRLLFSHKAKEKIKQFTPEKIVDQWENLFKSLII